MIISSLRKKIQMGALLFTLVLASSGCIYVAVAGLGALGGYVASPDTVEGIITGKEYSEVWDAMIEIVSIMGIIEERNQQGGMIIAKIQGAKVTVMAYNVSATAVKLSVKARKSMFPRIKISQDTYVKIASYLEDETVTEE